MSLAMKRIVLGIIVLLLIVSLACNSLYSLAQSGSDLKTADDYVKQFGGDVDVYNRILSMNDCTNLNNKYHLAVTKWIQQERLSPERKITHGYMEALSTRMAQINCAR